MSFNPNPYFAPRVTPLPVPRLEVPEAQVRWAKLPRAPITGSPVPHLTSLYHWHEPGKYGDRSYPGNCGGQLIRDVIRFFNVQSVLDPMSGSGTCRHVCQELRVPCHSTDLRLGADACDPATWPSEKAGLVWLHPPYFRQKICSSDERCLSRAPTLDAFLERYAALIRNAANALAPGGKLAILVGDYCDRTYGFCPLVYHTKQLAFAVGLRQATTDIIRFSHGASSGRKVYSSLFIPGLHDVLCVFEFPVRSRRPA